MIAGQLWKFGAFAGAAGAIVLGLLCIRLDRHVAAERLVSSELRTTLETVRGDAARAALKLSGEYRQIENSYRQLSEAAGDALNQAHRTIEDRAAAHRADVDRVRGEILAFAAGSFRDGGATADPIPACVDRADTLGHLLVDGLRVQGALAEGAEARAAEVRGLLSAWPRSVKVDGSARP